MPEYYFLYFNILHASLKYPALSGHKAEALHHHGAPLLCATAQHHACRLKALHFW
jgi:hypothetical protein